MTPGAEVLQKGKDEDQIFSLLFEKDELSWQTIILELIKSEQMDPWNIDVSTIADKFIKLLTEMTKMDFRISGKVILAAAFFLKIKSDKLLKEDIALLDQLIRPIENPDEILDMLDSMPDSLDLMKKQRPTLVIRTPQPRKRKVSVFDLIKSLEKALEVEQRRTFQQFNATPKKVRVPEKSKDMSLIIDELYDKITKTLDVVKIVWFKELVPAETREDKINTFVPLLYLENQRKIDLEQQKHFGDIKICLNKLAKSIKVAN